jgi:hypothetical protein
VDIERLKQDEYDDSPGQEATPAGLERIKHENWMSTTICREIMKRAT